MKKPLNLTKNYKIVKLTVVIYFSLKLLTNITIYTNQVNK